MAAEIRITINSENGGAGIADAQRDIQDLGDTAEKAGDGFNAMKEVGIGALRELGAAALNLAVAGVQALGSAVMDGIADARQNAQIQAQTAAVIKSMGNAAGVTAEQVAEYASSLSDAAGASLFGDDQIQESTNLLLTFGNIKGAALEAATALTVDLAQALGGDPKDQAMMLGKALNDPIAGIGALGKAGLTFSEEQKAMIAALVETGDVAGAQNIILAELEKQVGGSAAAAAQADGGWAQFNARLGEAKESIGTALLPVLGTMAGFLNDQVAPAIESLAAWLGENLPAAIATVQPVLTTIGGFFMRAGADAGGFAGALEQLGAVWTAIKGVIDAVVPPIQELINAVFGQIQIFLTAHGDDIKAFLGTTWAQIQEIIGIAAELVKAIIVPIFEGIKSFLDQHGTQIQAVLGAAWNIIKAVIGTALAIIKGVITTALAIIKGDWKGAWESVKTMLSTVWENIKTIFRNQLIIVQTIFLGAWETIKARFQLILDSVVGWVKQTFEGIKNTIISAIDGLASAAGRVGRGIIDGIINGIKSGVGSIISAAKDAAQAALDAAMDALGVGSPSKVFASMVGLPIAQGMAQGMLGGAPLVAQAADMTAGAAYRSASERVYNQQRSMTYAPVYNVTREPDMSQDPAFARSLAGAF